MTMVVRSTCLDFSPLCNVLQRIIGAMLLATGGGIWLRGSFSVGDAPREACYRTLVVSVAS